MTEIEETIKSLKEMFPKGLCEVDEYKMAQIAINALKQQIQKKPYIQQDNRNNDCLECPSCDSFIGYECDCRDEHYQINYCPNCGQAIDWSDEE